jgi:hypothetical protein
MGRRSQLLIKISANTEAERPAVPNASLPAAATKKSNK